MSDEADPQLVTHRSEAARWSVRGLGFAIGVTLVVGVIVALVLAWHVAVVVFVSILLGSAIEPAVTWGRDRLPVARGLAVIGLYVTVAVVVVAIALFVVQSVAAEAEGIAAGLPRALDAFEAWAAELRPEFVGAMAFSLSDAARVALTQAQPPSAEDVVGVGLSVAEVAVTTLTVFALVYFWTTERARLQRYVTAFLPLDRRAGARDAWNDIELRLGAWVRGELVLMGTVGVATATAYWLIGLPSAIVLGLIAGLAELIPLVGPVLGAIPAILVAAALRPDLLVPVVVVYLVIQLVEGNWLVPTVMRGSVGISPFVVIVSLLVGGAIGGVIGALMAIPLAAVVVVVLERLQARDVPVSLDAAAVDESAGDVGAADEVDDADIPSARTPAPMRGR